MERQTIVTQETITLSNGALRFTAHVAGEGPLVLLLHGFPDSPASFADQLPALAASGYRAVAPTMRGYQPSSQPADGDYHAVRMAEDVVAWLDQLGADRAHLVGHDWGANIAYAAAALAPDRFASLTAIAVPHPVRFGEAYAADADQQRRSAYIPSFLDPAADERIVKDNCSELVRLWRDWSPAWQGNEALLAAMRDVFTCPGVAKAALEYYRQAFDVASAAGQATAQLFATAIGVPTLGICGADDGCIRADIFAGAMRPGDFSAGVALAEVAGAGHFTHAEASQEVNQLLLRWFARHPI